MKPLRVIVVHHNQPDRCVETVGLVRSQNVPVDIVIVDNDSRAEAIEALHGIHDVRVVETGTNLGFGGGANVGLREWLDDTTAGEWALVLPHDARPAAGCLTTMLVAIAEHDDIGLVSAEYGEDALPAIDKVFGAVTVPAARGRGWADAGYAHGTFLLLRRACLESVGLFDESYFAYCEEADLALRARRAGWRAGMVWDAVVTNPHQGTPRAAIDYLMVRNTVVLVGRHFGRYYGGLRFLIAAVTTPWLMVSTRRRPPWFDGRARLLALRDVAVGRLGPPPAELLLGKHAVR